MTKNSRPPVESPTRTGILKPEASSATTDGLPRLLPLFAIFYSPLTAILTAFEAEETGAPIGRERNVSISCYLFLRNWRWRAQGDDLQAAADIFTFTATSETEFSGSRGHGRLSGLFEQHQKVIRQSV